MMPTLRAVLTALVLMLVFPSTSMAQPRADRVVDTLSDLLGLGRTVRGHVVQHREATLVLRGEDARTYTVNTAGLDQSELRTLRDGRPVTVTLKSPGPEGMPIASAVALRDGPAKVFRRVEGMVEAVTDDQIRFSTREGMALTLDRTRIIGEPPHVAPHETATLVYEEQPRLAGVWIEMREVQPAATPRER